MYGTLCLFYSEACIYRADGDRLVGVAGCDVEWRLPMLLERAAVGFVVSSAARRRYPSRRCRLARILCTATATRFTQ